MKFVNSICENIDVVPSKGTVNLYNHTYFCELYANQPNHVIIKPVFYY